jgi:hypothetical protein
MLETLAIKLEAWRELPQDRPQFFLEPQDTRSKEIGKRCLDVTKLLEVGDKSAALDRENKVFGSVLTPSRKRVRVLQRIVGAIDFDRVDLAAGISEFIGMPQSSRIKVATPSAIAPAGDTDADRSRATHRPAP